MDSTTRRQFLGRMAAGGPAILLANNLARADEAKPVETATIREGDLEVHLRDNSQSPGLLSGVDSLFNRKAAPDFDAYEPDSPPTSAGLNFEHIISGHETPNNKYTPRNGKCPLFLGADGKSATLVRQREDEPWAISSTMKYTVVAPHYIDVDFRCTPHKRALFGTRGYAVLFFANYMNDVADPNLHFRGIEGPQGAEKWITGDTPPGHADWKSGGTYRSRPAADLAYDDNVVFRLNTWSYDWPRFTQPFYYGLAAHDMVLMMMFNKMYGDDDEIRFSLFKFKLLRPQVELRQPRPAWDYQYVIRRIEEGREYGFKSRLVWKKFVSAEDCQREYDTWRASVAKS